MAATHVALLRAVNVGGHGKVPMADLCRVAEGCGLGEVRALMQTGNLLFRADATEAAIEAALEAAAKAALGLETDIMVRSAPDWAALVAADPFPEAAEADPGHLVALLLKKAPDGAALGALRAAIVGREQVAAAGRTLYAVYPDGIGRSKLTTALIERTLGTRATGRNWNTTLKIAALLGG